MPRRPTASRISTARSTTAGASAWWSTTTGSCSGSSGREVLQLPADTPVSDVMQPAPPTVRPSITAAELAQSMDKDHRSYVLVSLLDGTLLGIIQREDLYGQH